MSRQPPGEARGYTAENSPASATDPAGTAVREVAEETGVRLGTGDLELLGHEVFRPAPVEGRDLLAFFTARLVGSPALRTDEGRRTWSWLLGEGEMRGIALIFLIGGLGFMFDAWDVALNGVMIPLLREEWALDKADAAWIGTANLIGMAVGAFLWGTIADRIGRKAAFAWTLAIFSVFTIAGALTDSLLWFA